MTRPSLGRLLWVHNIARPHHKGGSGAATCPEKVIYPKASTVSPEPHGRVPDPWIYSPDHQGWSRTSTCASRTPGMGSGPPPPVWGPGRPQWDPNVQGQNILGPSTGPKRGSGADTCPDLVWWIPDLSAKTPAPPLKRRPIAATWHTACGLSQRVEPRMTPLGYARLHIHYG
jgi:hypothetical protein